MPRQKGHKKGAADSKGVAGTAKKAALKNSGSGKGAAGGRQGGASLETLESERRKVLEQLKGVEEQVFKLETAYFQKADPYGNALKGYSGLLDRPPEPKRSRTTPLHKDERVFSGSSVSGFVTTQEPSEENAA